MDQISLKEHFCKYFQLRLVSDASEKMQAYQLRYQVYCQEFAFKNPADFPDQLEVDSFDLDAKHILLIHKPSGFVAGCFRLIFADPTRNSKGLPIAQYCRNAVDQRLFDFDKQDPSRYAEISRLAVHERFRRRHDERLTPSAVAQGNFESLARQRDFPHIPLSMFLAASAMSELYGLDCVIVMMEPRLARLLKLCGIHFQAIGDVVDYYGLRAPFISYVDKLRTYLSSDARELLDYLYQEFSLFQDEHNHYKGLTHGISL